MLCCVCHKNEATVHINEITNGKVTHLDLCGECAAKKEAGGTFGALGFNLAGLLFNLEKIAEEKSAEAGVSKPETADPEAPAAALHCPVCGWTLDKVRKTGGRLGCPACYRTFQKIIDEALSRIQRGGVHLGKRPSGKAENLTSLHLQLESARQELLELVKKEEYEAAALCRDRITALKEQLKGEAAK